MRYPVRVALNPFISTIGYLLPYVVSGSIIVSLVLSLPTVGPLLLKALIAQDMFLAGTIILLLGVMTVIGTFISDLLLMWVDPADPVREGVMAELAAVSAARRRESSPRTASPSPRSGSSSGGASASTSSPWAGPSSWSRFISSRCSPTFSPMSIRRNRKPSDR